MMKMAVRKGMALVVATLATMSLWAEGALNHAWTEVAKDVASYTHDPNGIVYAYTIFGFTETVTFAEGSVNNAIIFKMPGETKTINLETTAEGTYQLKVQHGNGDNNTIVQTSEKTATAGEHRYSVFVRRGPDGNGQCVGAVIIWCDGEELFKVQEPMRNYGAGPLRRIEFGNTTGNTISAAIWNAVDAINAQYAVGTDDTKIAEIEDDSKILFATDNVVTGEAQGEVAFSAINWSKTTSSVKLTLTGDATITLDQAKPLRVEVVKAEGIESAKLNLVAKDALWFPNSLGAGVSYGVATISDETVETVRNAAIIVPSDCTLFINGRAKSTEDPLKIKGLITIPSGSKLETAGQVKITPHDETPTTNNTSGSVINAGATMEVLDGTTAMKFADRGLKGVLTIDAEATLKPIDFVDACNYDGSSTVNVYGTLDMNDSWARWTLRKNNIMNFYTGSTTKGNGQSGTNTGALQFNNSRECVLNFVKTEESDTVVMDAMVHAENAFTMNVADGVTVTMNNGLGTGKNPVTITGGGTVVMKSAYAFNDAITVNADAMLEFVDNGAVANGVKGEGAVVFSTTTPVFGTVYRSPLNLTLAEGTTSIAVQVTDGEMTEGEVAFKFTNAELPAGITWTVTKAGGTTVNAEVGDKAEDGTVTLTLGVTKYEASTKTSEWNESVTGRVIIQGPTEEAAEGVTLTYDSEIAEAIEEIYFVGKVTIIAAEGQKIPAGRFRFAPGAEVTLANDFYASMTLTNGATLKVRDVTLTKAITVQDGAKLVFGGSVTLGTGGSIATTGQKNSVIEILPAATLKLTANDQIGTMVKVNIYGTLDIGTTTLTYNNNPDQCEYNFYAGSVMTGTTGVFKMAGGHTAKYYVRAYAAAENQYATVDVLRARDAYDRETEIYVDYGVGLKWLKPERTGHTQPVKVIGADVRGLEIQGATNIKFGNNERGLKGDLVIGTGAKLTLTRTDSLEYNSLNNSPVINLDIAGTLDCGAFRQTLSNSGNGHVAGKMVLRDGGQIIGEGADWGGTMCALDMWKPATIEVVGTATITAPTYSESETSKLTVKPLADNGSGLLVLAQWNANATIDLQPGAQVQLPSSVDASKVVTTARGWMIASKSAAEEGQTVYRTVPKFFTISIR